MGTLQRRRLKIFYDGGCRPNPGRIEVAIVARGETYFFDDLGDGTSSDAEWTALRLALKVAHSLGEPDFDLIGDCANVIAQANGRTKCRSEQARAHRASFHEAAATGPPKRVRWTPRNQNLAGIALARRRAGFRPQRVERSAGPALVPLHRCSQNLRSRGHGSVDYEVDLGHGLYAARVRDRLWIGKEGGHDVTGAASREDAVRRGGERDGARPSDQAGSDRPDHSRRQARVQRAEHNEDGRAGKSPTANVRASKIGAVSNEPAEGEG